jgi:YteA family regulatory protein
LNTLTEAQIQELIQQLVEQKTNLERRIDNTNHFGLENAQRDWPFELSTYDNHPADLGTETFEMGKDLALNENAEANLREVTEALAIIRTDDYGICVTCRQPIPFERLQAIPETRFCVTHTPEQEISDRRPVEEEVLFPPFGRTSLDANSGNTQFDGEDAWQIVESWGNSDSPAMSENREVHGYDDLFIEADEHEGYVEDFESFIATDIYGKEVSIVRNKAYRQYMDNREGEPLLEPEERENTLD